MDKPYRWGDVTPPAVQVIKKRRQYRGSQLYQTIKRGRRQEIVEPAARATSADPMPWIVAPQPPIDEAVTVYDPIKGIVSMPPDVERNWYGEPINSSASCPATPASDGSQFSSSPRTAGPA